MILSNQIYVLGLENLNLFGKLSKYITSKKAVI